MQQSVETRRFISTPFRRKQDKFFENKILRGASAVSD